MTDYQDDEYRNEIIIRAAPRWAWDVLDEWADPHTIEAAHEEREVVTRAVQAMIDASEKAA